MYCWNCAKELEDRPIVFRAICDYCMAYLHCCKNCKNYKPGMPNDCLIPGTEPIADREKGNYCEEFSLIGKILDKGPSASDVSKKLFGDDDPPNKKDFNSLFDS